MPLAEPLLPFSSQSREGRQQLWRHLEAMLTPVHRQQEKASSSQCGWRMADGGMENREG
jgi:hypothetical protein